MANFGQNPKIRKTPKRPLQKQDVLKGLLTKLPIVKSQFRRFCQKGSKRGFGPPKWGPEAKNGVRRPQNGVWGPKNGVWRVKMGSGTQKWGLGTPKWGLGTQKWGPEGQKWGFGPQKWGLEAKNRQKWLKMTKIC